MIYPHHYLNAGLYILLVSEAPRVLFMQQKGHDHSHNDHDEHNCLDLWNYEGDITSSIVVNDDRCDPCGI